MTDRQAHHESRAPTRGILDDQATAVLVDHHVHGNRKALPGTLADRLGGEKRIEHPLAQGIRNAGTIVGDANFDDIAVLARRNPDHAHFPSPFQGLRRIHDQIQQYLIDVSR